MGAHNPCWALKPADVDQVEPVEDQEQPGNRAERAGLHLVDHAVGQRTGAALGIQRGRGVEQALVQLDGAFQLLNEDEVRRRYLHPVKAKAA